MILDHIGLRMLIWWQKHFGEGSERRKLGFARRGDFGVISSHFLLLNDQESWVKKIQRDLKVRTKP